MHRPASHPPSEWQVVVAFTLACAKRYQRSKSAGVGFNQSKRGDCERTLTPASFFSVTLFSDFN